jgi:hypothetical protein
MCVCDCCNLFYINNVRIWIAERFNIDSLCVILNSTFKCTLFVRVYKSCLNAICWECMLKKIIRTTINCFCSNNVVACTCKVLNCICYSCCTTCYCKSCYTTLKSCNSLLKNILCWVSKSAINVTCIFKCKSICGVL